MKVVSKGFLVALIALVCSASFSFGQADRSSEEIFAVVEESAKPQGGMAEFYKYLASNMIIPEEVKNGTVSGRVSIEFLIDSTGVIVPDKVFVVQSLSRACDAEAVRLIRGSPPWSPGMSRGKPVRQRYTLPVIFKTK